jgi:integrase
MAQRQHAERVLGPYLVRGRWRVIVVKATGERASREYETLAEARQVIRSVTRETNQEERTVRQAPTQYEKYMIDEKGNKPRTLENNLWRVRVFFPDDEEPVDSVTPLKGQGYYDLVRQRTTRAGKPMSVDSHRAILAAAKTFLGWCVNRKWITRNPLAEVKEIGKRRHGKEQLRIGEARKWKDKAVEMAQRGSSGAVAALMALVMGLRASEIVGRVVRDVDDEGKLLWIPTSKTEAGKRTLQIPEVLRPFLLALVKGKRSDELLFGHHYRDWVRDWVHRICQAAGVPKVTAHGMRGLPGTIAVEAGVTGHLVAAALGHESEEITYQSYVKESALADTRQRRLLTVLDGGSKLAS